MMAAHRLALNNDRADSLSIAAPAQNEVFVELRPGVGRHCHTS
jgi:hypothetical protein